MGLVTCCRIAALRPIRVNKVTQTCEQNFGKRAQETDDQMKTMNEKDE
jgi:hypothetical protein